MWVDDALRLIFVGEHVSTGVTLRWSSTEEKAINYCSVLLFVAIFGQSARTQVMRTDKKSMESCLSQRCSGVYLPF